MTSASDKPLLLLIGSSARRSRESILQAVSERYALWLLQPRAVSWEEPYVVGGTVVDNTLVEPLIEAARRVAAQREVAGVFCYDEGLVTPAAHVAQALGLPGNSPEAVAACRDKHATRTALAKAGVPQPASIGVRSLAQAREAAAEIGFPVVLKPRGLAGSMGVTRVDDPAEIEDAYRIATAVSYPGVPVFDVSVLVEQCLIGQEISIDAAFFDGECVPLILARKQVGLAPFFEEFGHDIDAADPLLADQALLDALRDAHAALGFHTGVSHTEFFITADGPRLVEVNARMGGDMHPYLCRRITGVDEAMVAADIAAGRRPQTRATLRRAAAVHFLYPEQDIAVESIEVPAEADLPPNVDSVVPMVDPGAELRLPPRGYISRYARILTVADTIGEARAAVQQAAALVTLTGRVTQESSR